jgi:multidrug resistance efflux pump
MNQVSYQAEQAPGPGPATAAPDHEPPETKPEPPPQARHNPIRSWTIRILILLAVLLAYHVVADRITPYTPLAYVQAFIVQVAPQVAGTVTEVDVVDNQRVDQGDVLFRIDPQPFRLAVDAAEAALAQAGQTIGASTAGVASAQAEVVEAQARLENIRIQAARVLELVERGVYAAARGDQARTEIETAEAELETAQAELDRARETLGPEGQENPEIRAATAALEQARLDLLYATVTAPTDGLITNLQLSAGQYVNTGQPVLTLIDIRDVWLVASMRENSLGNIEAGDEVEIALDVRPGQIFKGRVESIGWGIARGQGTPSGELPQSERRQDWLLDSQRFPVRIDFAESDLLRAVRDGIRVGSQANVIVYTDPDSIMNPIGRLWIRLVTLLSYVY